MSFPSRDEAKANALRIFTKPGLADIVIKIQEGYFVNSPNADQLLTDLRASLIQQGEYEFEQQVKDYPIVVEVPKHKFENNYQGKSRGDPSPLFKEIETWLYANIPGTEFIAFPTTAVGKHMDCCFNVYFKTSQYAVYFKVSYPF